jgi:two-component system NtrC family sensor kinase
MSIEFVEDLKRQWMAMIDSIDDPLVIIDSDFHILRQNLAYTRVATDGKFYSIREFQGKKCYEVFAGRKTPCSHCLVKESLKTTETVEWQCNSLFPEREYQIRAHKLHSSKGDPCDWVVVHYRDLTEQKMMQERLAQSDKLAALGKLAGGVAHEINSPLAGILAFAQMALKEMDESDPHRSDLREIEDAAKKCKTIVEGLLGFARQGRSGDVGEFNLFDVVHSTIRLAVPVIRKHGIELVVDLPEDPAQVVANPGKIGQVFLNLITNAIQAMQESGGTLTVDSKVEDTSVTVSVHDTGYGILGENLKRIFDPFFTTKEVGEGTGLGLSISYSIVKQYGGEVRVQSSAGVGSSFSVVLPLAVHREPLRVV